MKNETTIKVPKKYAQIVDEISYSGELIEVVLNSGYAFNDGFHRNHFLSGEAVLEAISQAAACECDMCKQSLAEKTRQLNEKITESKSTVKEDTKLKKTRPQSAQSETTVVSVGIDLLDESPLNFFHPLKAKKKKELTESIKTIGLLHPIIVREKENNRYEILAGRNRTDIYRELGYKTIDAIVKNVNDDDAEEIIADSNMAQRDELSPLEIAKAYEIKARNLERRQGKRTDLNSSEEKYNWREIVGKEFSVSGMTVDRYLRLNNLNERFKDLLDEERISTKTCFEIGKLDKETQEAILQNVDTDSDEEVKKISAKLVKEIRDTLKEKNDYSKEEIKAMKKEGKSPTVSPLTSGEVERIMASISEKKESDLTLKLSVPKESEHLERIAELFDTEPSTIIALVSKFLDGEITLI